MTSITKDKFSSEVYKTKQKEFSFEFAFVLLFHFNRIVAYFIVSISCLSVHETIKYATFRYGMVEVENGLYARSLMLMLMLMLMLRLMSMFMTHALVDFFVLSCFTRLTSKPGLEPSFHTYFELYYRL